MSAESNNKASVQTQRKPSGLRGLPQVELTGWRKEVLDQGMKHCGGSPSLRARKRAEAHDLLALSQITSRLEIMELDLRHMIRASIHLRTPVPCMTEPDGPLLLEYDALLGLAYREESFCKPTPGYGFFQVLVPTACWHANISHDGVQALCLGASLPAGIRVKDLVLMAYGALSMQTVMVDELDPVGVMNREAATWWQANMHRLPLTSAPFLCDVEHT